MTTEKNLEIKGNLLRHFPAELLVEITQTKLSGSLRFSNKEQKIIIYIESGKVVFAVSNSRQHRLFQVLLDENQISKRDLLKIEQVTNDIYLTKHLVDKNIFRKDDVDKFIRFQINKIVQTVIDWQTGEWIFSPLARVQRELKLPVNISPILQKFANNLDKQNISGRFKTLEEIFYLNETNPQDDFGQSDLNSQDFFILSRFGKNKLDVKEIQSISGLPNNEVLQILYKLWLCGLVCRNWNSPFDKETLLKINNAKYSLIKSAVTVEDQESERKAEEEKSRLEAEEAEKEAEKEKQNEKNSLEKYLKQIENAATHYEMFGISSDAEISEIKTAYFSFAKKFHPDLFYKEVDKKLHQRIQTTFTELANAYDTLKDENSREIYNFRLRKAIEALDKNESESNESSSNSVDNSKLASENFETGYNLLLEEKFNEATPYLATAVQLNSDNARYHAFYGKALSKDRKQHRKAATEIQEAINLDSRNSIYRMMLAELYVEVGLLTSAKGELNRLLEFEPNNQEALSLLDRLDK